MSFLKCRIHYKWCSVCTLIFRSLIIKYLWYRFMFCNGPEGYFPPLEYEAGPVDFNSFFYFFPMLKWYIVRVHNREMLNTKPWDRDSSSSLQQAPHLELHNVSATRHMLTLPSVWPRDGSVWFSSSLSEVFRNVWVLLNSHPNVISDAPQWFITQLCEQN